MSEMPKLVQTAKVLPAKIFRFSPYSEPYDPLESVKDYCRQPRAAFAVMYDADGSVGKARHRSLSHLVFHQQKKARF